MKCKVNHFILHPQTLLLNKKKKTEINRTTANKSIKIKYFKTCLSNKINRNEKKAEQTRLIYSSNRSGRNAFVLA